MVRYRLFTMLRPCSALLLAGAVSACASEIVDDRGPGDAAAQGGSGGGDGGTGGAGGSDLLPAFVVFENLALAEQPDLVYGTAYAQFDATKVDRGCTVREFGACSVTTCPPETEALDAADADAGIMTVSGTSPVLPESDDVDDGYQLYADGALFGNGDVPTASFSGARVPAFSESVPAPWRAVEHSPPLSTLTTLPRSGLALTWKLEGDGAGVSLFALDPTVVDPDDDVPYERMSCSVPASDGVLVIPPEAMTALSGRGTFLLFAGTACGKEVEVGEWNVNVQANDLTLVQDVVIE